MRDIFSRLVPSPIVQRLRALNLLQNYVSQHEWVEKPGGENILVLAPHPDDEVLGCGGTLYKHSQGGVQITVLYLTTGAQATEKTLIQERQEEAKRGGKVLGINRFEFWDYPKQSLPASEETVNKMEEFLSFAHFDLVYLPSFLDNHVDHRVTNEIFVRACERLKKPPECYAYEVWTPLIPNRFVDITDVIDVKRKAIMFHKSQIKYKDKNYSINYFGLNAYRALYVDAPEIIYSEAFLHCTNHEYRALYNSFMGGR